MKKPFYIVNSFGKDAFNGYSEGVCFLDNKKLLKSKMQKLAAEIKLKSIIFVSNDKTNNNQGRNIFRVKMFDPFMEVEITYSALIAAAHIINETVTDLNEAIFILSTSQKVFISKSKEKCFYKFTVEQTKHSDLLSQVEVLSLVTILLKPLVSVADIKISHQSKIILIQMDNCVNKSNLEKLNISEILKLREIDNTEFNVVVTSRADMTDMYDFYYKEFSNKASTCDSSPFSLLSQHWSKVVGKTTLMARNLSNRGSDIKMVVKNGALVEVTGQCTTVFKGLITVREVSES